MLPASTGRLEGSGSVRTRTILCPRRICTSLRFDPPGHVQQRLGSRAPTRTCALCVRIMRARELIVQSNKRDSTGIRRRGKPLQNRERSSTRGRGRRFAT